MVRACDIGFCTVSSAVQRSSPDTQLLLNGSAAHYFNYKLIHKFIQDILIKSGLISTASYKSQSKVHFDQQGKQVSARSNKRRIHARQDYRLRRAVTFVAGV